MLSISFVVAGPHGDWEIHTIRDEPRIDGSSRFTLAAERHTKTAPFLVHHASGMGATFEEAYTDLKNRIHIKDSRSKH